MSDCSSLGAYMYPLELAGNTSTGGGGRWTPLQDFRNGLELAHAL